MADKLHRAPRLPRKPEPPESLKAAAERAKRRTLTRDTALPLMIERDKSGNVIVGADGEVQWNWPFDSETPADWPEWSWMFVDSWGTRNSAVASAFMDHLLDLVSDYWDAKIERRVPDDGELQMLLAVVRSHKPANEAEAAQAAQVAAMHIISMRVAKEVAKRPYDTRMVSAYARLMSASAALTEAAAGRKGKRTARQSIKVVRETHIHNHQHVHAHASGGGEEKENRGHGTNGPDKIKAAVLVGKCTPLPRNEPGGEVVRLAGRSGKARV